MAENYLPKEAICREYSRLGAAMPKSDTAGRARLAALHTKAEETLSTDTLALVELTKELEAYQANPDADPDMGEEPAASAR